MGSLRVRGLSLAVASVVAGCDLGSGFEVDPRTRGVLLLPTLVVPLAEVGGSGTTGTAMIIDTISAHSLVIVSLEGMVPQTSHAGHVHFGTCSEPGGVEVDLEPVEAGAAGDGSVVTRQVPDERLGPDFLLDYHETLEPTSPQIVCAEVPRFRASGIVGAAIITDDDGPTSTLQVTLEGIEPGSQHAGHVHAGACTAQGAIEVDLSSITGGEDRIGASTTLDVSDEVLTLGHYLDYHEALDPTGPVVSCGNVD